MTDYYREQLRIGQEYQDFVFEQLRKMDGMPIFLGAYSSKKYQFKKGESPSGLEIKFDGKFKDTGNLYIEVAEKSSPDMPEYTLSGVMRENNSILYLIGDYEQAFLLGTIRTRYLCNISNSHIRFVQTKTSQGYLFPLDYIKDTNNYVKHIIWDKNL